MVVKFVCNSDSDQASDRQGAACRAKDRHLDPRRERKPLVCRPSRTGLPARRKAASRHGPTGDVRQGSRDGNDPSHGGIDLFECDLRHGLWHRLRHDAAQHRNQQRNRGEVQIILYDHVILDLRPQRRKEFGNNFVKHPKCSN